MRPSNINFDSAATAHLPALHPALGISLIPGRHRVNNLAQCLAPTIIKIFPKGTDGEFRGEVNIDDDERKKIARCDIAQYAKELVAPMFDRNWHFEPSGLVAIPKEKGGHRFIAASRSRDRIRSRGIYDIVGPILDRYFRHSMFGFRPALGCFPALARLKAKMSLAVNEYVVFLDVVRCFPSIPLDRVMAELQTIIGCKDTLRWIRDDVRTRPPAWRIETVRRELMGCETALPADFTHLDAMRSQDRGKREGSALSPLLCNLYLRPMIELIETSDPNISIIN